MSNSVRYSLPRSVGVSQSYMKLPINRHNQITDNRIEFLSINKVTKKSKNFVVLNKGLPIRNKTFYLKVNLTHTNAQDIPLFKTDKNGIMYILTNPSLNILTKPSLGNDFEYYQPIKLSKRLGFVVKDSQNFSKLNLLYQFKILGKYIDIGLSSDFLKRVIEKSDIGKNKIDIVNSSVVNNWKQLYLDNQEATPEYHFFNSHTERTKRTRKIIDYASYVALGLGGLGAVATAGIAIAGLLPPISVAISGGVLSMGSSLESISRHLYNQPLVVKQDRHKKTNAILKID